MGRKTRRSSATPPRSRPSWCVASTVSPRRHVITFGPIAYLPDDTSSSLAQSRRATSTRADQSHNAPAVPSDRVRRGFHVAQRDEVSQRAQRRRRGRGRRRAREQGMGRDETAADDERRGVLAFRRVAVTARIADVTRARREAVHDGSQVRSIHWSPYDGVRVVNADP